MNPTDVPLKIPLSSEYLATLTTTVCCICATTLLSYMYPLDVSRQATLSVERQMTSLTYMVSLVSVDDAVSVVVTGVDKGFVTIRADEGGREVWVLSFGVVSEVCF